MNGLQLKENLMNDFMYPEDRGEIYGDVNEEEAYFYHVLMDFEYLIQKYGAHTVLSRMRNDPFSELAEWFYEMER